MCVREGREGIAAVPSVCERWRVAVVCVCSSELPVVCVCVCVREREREDVINLGEDFNLADMCRL